MHNPNYYFKMKINNPKVTLADDARVGVKEELRSGFLDWLHQFSVIGDDGAMSVRQWHPYPSILPRELYLDSAGEVSCDTKFDTL